MLVWLQRKDKRIMTPLAHIGFERRRQIQVRKAFEQGLALDNSPEVDRFLLACGTYIVVSLDRLDQQDQMISDFLRERAAAEDAQLRSQLDTLDDRQVKCRDMMARFDDALQSFQENPAQRAALFREKADDFVAEFNGMMAPRKNPLSPYTDKHFDLEDWAAIADWTEEAKSREAALFAAVEQSAPNGLDPNGFTAEHLPN